MTQLTETRIGSPELMASLSQQVGNTPLLAIESLGSDKVKVYGKAEWMQLGNSVKARAAFNIISSALRNGQLQDRVLLDASSGNTAIAYASICARLSIPIEICLPANASAKRKSILHALGAQLHLTSELEGTDGAQREAKNLAEAHPDKYFYADQYNNDANWKAHYYTTALEIWEQTNKKLTHFVAGLGTTGSFVGTAQRLKELNPEIRTIALQPNSPMHFLEGWKHLPTAKVPGIYNDRNVDQLLEINSEDSIAFVKRIAREEGLLISPSSAANLLGAKRIADTLEEGVVVTILPDDISKYDEVLNMI
ncbi:MAG: cysteine synthase family protein [Saprospiraceae bacterium]|nr:cysteine synthase family protein [Saprospiraceae bacterium]